MAMKLAGGKYLGVWINALENDDFYTMAAIETGMAIRTKFR